MYKSGKAKRDKRGRVVKAAEFQSKALPSTRIQPDRRWFGNTRVIGQKQLDQFRTAMADKVLAEDLCLLLSHTVVLQVDNNYTVLLREKKLPMTLLEDPEKKMAGKQLRADLLTVAPYQATFGAKKTRKRPRIAAEDYDSLVQAAQDKEAQCVELLDSTVFTASSRFGARQEDEPGPSSDGVRAAVRHSMFDKGQSKRIWGELYKVVDSSDVIIQVPPTWSACARVPALLHQCLSSTSRLQVVDARDPMGTRCRHLEWYLRKEARQKHMIILLNKCDLVRVTGVGPWEDYDVVRTIRCGHTLTNKHQWNLVSLRDTMCQMYCGVAHHCTCVLCMHFHISTSGAGVGHKALAAHAQQGLPHPRVSRVDHQPLWQGRPAVPLEAARAAACGQKVHLRGVCGLSECWQEQRHQHAPHEKGVLCLPVYCIEHVPCVGDGLKSDAEDLPWRCNTCVPAHGH